jgi:fatty-acyl-CoA synthase
MKFPEAKEDRGEGRFDGVVRDIDDVRAIEGVPLERRDLPASTLGMLERGMRIDPEAQALTFFLDGKRYAKAWTWSHRALYQQVVKAANLFHSLGISKDDVISYVLPNLPETHFVLWGAEAAGIVNPINPLLESDAMADLMRAAETRVLVTLAPTPGSDLWERLAGVIDSVPTLETVLQVDLAGYVGRLPAGVLRLKAWRSRRAASGRGPVVTSFNARLQEQSGGALESGRVIDPDDVASLFHTGGTTGAPKLARRTHRNEVYNAWAGATVSDIDASVRVLCGLPLFHAHAALILGLSPWSRGASVVLATPQGYRGEGVIERFWSICGHFGVNVFSGVPTLFNTLLSRPAPAGPPGIDYAFCGAAPLSEHVHRKFERVFGIPLLEGYGLTEGTCISTVTPRHGQRQPGQVGIRIPYQALMAARVDASGRIERSSATGEVGELLIRGPNVFAGYRRVEHEADTWAVDRDGRSWLRTGDLGCIDGSGRVQIRGRAKDLIIRGGHNIDPAMIEDALYEHDDVEAVAVVARPDRHAGEVPVAYLQPRDGATLDVEALMAFAQRRVAERPAWPRSIHVIERMPCTSVGKIYKPELRRREAISAVEERLQAVSPELAAGIASIEWSDGAISIRTIDEPAPAGLAERIRDALAEFGFEVRVFGREGIDRERPPEGRGGP